MFGSYAECTVYAFKLDTGGVKVLAEPHVPSGRTMMIKDEDHDFIEPSTDINILTKPSWFFFQQLIK